MSLVPDVAYIYKVEPPGIFPQAFYVHQLLEVADDRIPVPPGQTVEPFTVGRAKGLRGEYVITDWFQQGGGDVFTARLIGDKDASTEWRFSILPWWWVLGAGAALVGLGWLVDKMWPRGGAQAAKA